MSWAGFDESHDTWEPAGNLHPDAIAEYRRSDLLSEYELDRLDKIASNQVTSQCHAYMDVRMYSLYTLEHDSGLHTLPSLPPLGIPQPAA